MDRKPRPKVILLIAEFKKKLRQLHKHFTKTHKNQKKNASGKAISLKDETDLKTCQNIFVSPVSGGYDKLNNLKSKSEKGLITATKVIAS